MDRTAVITPLPRISSGFHSADPVFAACPIQHDGQTRIDFGAARAPLQT
jgi:hypothetical protein